MPIGQNVLLITSDQQHWFTLGLQNPEIKTPNLDRLAKSGFMSNRAYCPNPTCTPTRASLITGQYPSQHGAYTLGTKLPENALTLGELMQKQQQRSILIGKAHFQPLASTPEYSSLEAYPILHDQAFWKDYRESFYGFDTVELTRNHTDESHVGQHYVLWLEKQGFDWKPYYNRPAGLKEPGEGIAGGGSSYKWEIPEKYHYNAWIAERCNDHLEQLAQHGENFFMWASFLDPHPPYLVPEPWASMYDPKTLTVPCGREGEHDRNPHHFRETQKAQPDFQRYKDPQNDFWIHGFGCHLHDREELAKQVAIYYGMISMMDHYIGKILDRLESLGLQDRTLVVFTSDHGHFYGHHGLIAKGAFHYEDMIRVPFIASYPGVIPAGQMSEAMVSLVDFAPTALSSMGMNIPRCMTGKDLMPLLSGKVAQVRDHIVVENHHTPITVHAKTYVEERYKITVYQNSQEGEIFDLLDDPGEFNNLWFSRDHLELKCRLLLKLQQAEMEKEPMWMPRIYGA